MSDATQKVDPEKSKQIILIIFATCGILFFVVGVIYAGIFTLAHGAGDKENVFPEVFTYAVTAIGAVLATNLGAYLGITIEQIRTGVHTRTRDLQETFKTIAFIVYAAAMFTALVFWGVSGFDPREEVVSVLPELTFTLLGVGGSSLALLLGVSAQRS